MVLLCEYCMIYLLGEHGGVVSLETAGQHTLTHIVPEGLVIGKVTIFLIKTPIRIVIGKFNVLLLSIRIPIDMNEKHYKEKHTPR